MQNLIPSMELPALAGHGYLLIGGLILVGAGLLVLSLIVNTRVANSVRQDQRHREKLFEYYRNTFSQLGVILIGIGVSLFIFYFQQNYQDQRRYDTEVRQVLSRLSVRLSRAAATTRSFDEFDALLDVGGPWINPEDGGDNGAAKMDGADLAAQIRALRLVRRDVDLEEFSVFAFSRDFEASPLVDNLDPHLWFAMVSDEADVRYAVGQLAKDYEDLDAAIGDASVEAAVVDPVKREDVKHEVIDILYDMNLLRDRARRLVARACWVAAAGPNFTALRPVEAVEQDHKAHTEWIAQVSKAYAEIEIGGERCIDMLDYRQTSNQ